MAAGLFESVENKPCAGPNSYDHEEVLRLSGVSKSFGKYPALRNISFKASLGEVVSVIGGSGSGKSTLLRCINLLELPDIGEIWVHGEQLRLRPISRWARATPLDRRQLQRVRSRFGMVFQSFNLWANKTVLENVIEAPIHVLGRGRSDAIERAEYLLARVGVAEKRFHYPNHLSGGQQQRVAIARALAMEPALLLFDEPTSALDPESIRDVINVMRDLVEEGRTMLVVTHEIGFAREISSRVVFMHEGRIEEQGSPTDLFRNPSSERLRRFLASEIEGLPNVP